MSKRLTGWLGLAVMLAVLAVPRVGTACPS
jgi:hypothetical protein